MRDFVQRISSYAKALVPDFLIIPQNGGELLTKDGKEYGLPAEVYIAALKTSSFGACCSRTLLADSSCSLRQLIFHS